MSRWRPPRRSAARSWGRVNRAASRGPGASRSATARWRRWLGVTAPQWRSPAGARARRRRMGRRCALVPGAARRPGAKWRPAGAFVQLDPPHRAARYSGTAGRCGRFTPTPMGCFGAGTGRGPSSWSGNGVRSTLDDGSPARSIPALLRHGLARHRSRRGARGARGVRGFSCAGALPGVAREEIARSGAQLPLWGASREDLHVAGPLGAAQLGIGTRSQGLRGTFA